MSKSAWRNRGKTQGAAATATADITIPEIRTPDKHAARPAILVRGMSGTGKTEGIAQLLASGLNGLIIAIEDKIQSCLRYDPAVMYIGEPVVDTATGSARPPTLAERWRRIHLVKEALASGDLREWQGKPFDFIAVEGLMEVSDVFYRHKLEEMPISKKTGERNTFELYNQVGMEIVDFVKDLRAAASEATTLFGVPPVTIYCTTGEKRVEPKVGPSYYEPVLAGKMAGVALPYQFEAILRLSIQRNEDNKKAYVMETMGEQGGFESKVPAGADLAPEILNWNMRDVYDKILQAYRGEVITDTQKEETE